MQLNMNKVALALAAAGLVSGLAGCGGGGGGGTLGGFDNPQVQKSNATGVTLAFVDANDTSKYITEQVSFTLTVTSQTPSMLTTQPDADGKGTVLKSGTQQSTSSGLFELNADFSSGGSFTVTPDSSTWISYPPTVTKEGTVVIKLLKKDSAGNSTYVTASASKTLTAEIPASSGLGAAKITIAQDPALGDLSIAVVKFADSKVAQLNALNQGSFLLSDQAPMARFVVTDSTGKVIKDFPNGVTLQMQLADQSLAEGDYSGVIRSYDEEAGWTTKNVVNGKSDPYVAGDRDRIDNAKIISVNGVKVLEFTAYHLSIWSLAYTAAGYCTSSSLTLTGRPSGNSDGIDFRMVDNATQGTVFNKTRTGVTDNTLSLFFVPNFPVNVIATKTGTNPPQEVGRLTNVSFCIPPTPPSTTPVSQPQTMQLQNLVAPTPATLRVNVIEACSDDINVTRPGPTTVQFTPAGSTLPAGGWTGDDGSIDITKVFNPFNLEVPLTLGTVGTLRIWNRFTSQWDTVPTTGASFTVDGINDDDGDNDLETVNWRITTTCNIPTGVTGSTGQF
jgi:hypothetical protein